MELEETIRTSQRRAPYTQYDEREYVEPVTTHRASSQQRSAGRPAPDTYDDEKLNAVPQRRATRFLAPEPQQTLAIRPYRDQGQQPRRSLWFFFGMGMLVLLVVWSLLLHIGVWYINTLHDPSTYTQTAHLDQTTFIDAQGHQYQARGFIDPRNHMDLLVMPVDGDTSKARIIVGPVIANVDDPQHQTVITATTHGTMVTVLAQGPLMAGWFDLTAQRQGLQWSTDASQKGGK